jgi:tetratricopeptide (TPR) repeat protein
MRGSIEHKLLSLVAAAAIISAAWLGACSDDNGDGDSASTATSAAGGSGTTAVTGLTAPSTFTTTQSGGSAPKAADTQPGVATVGGKEREEYEAEIAEIEAKLQSSPNDLALLQKLAVAQYQTDRLDEAAATYEKMLSIDDQALTRNNYGNVLRDAGRRTEAKKEYEKALEMDPALTVSYVNLSSLLVMMDKKADALKVLEAGIAATSGDDRSRLQQIKANLEKEEG